MTQAGSPWPRVALLFGTGLLAAAQLGKLSALAPLLVPALGLSLSTMAWAVSLLELGGALLGVVAATLAGRIGLERTLVGALAALGLAGLGMAAADGAAALLGWRLLEAAGYLGVTVTAPVLIVRCARPFGLRTQGLALTLWSNFVPLGLALGATGAGLGAVMLGWRGTLAAGGVLAALLGAAVAISLGRASAALPRTPVFNATPSGPLPGTTHASRPVASSAQAAAESSAGAVHGAATDPGGDPPADRPAVAALVLAFGLFAMFEVGVLALLPTLLVEQAGLGAAAAGSWTGVASASAIAGSVWAALLLRRGAAARGPMLLSVAVPALLLPGVFRDSPSVLLAVSLATAVIGIGGVFASLAFARLPQLAGGAAGLVRANGWLAQCGASGSLLGPPAMAAAVQWGGWTAAGLLGVLVSALALPLVWRATRTDGRAARPPA